MKTDRLLFFCLLTALLFSFTSCCQTFQEEGTLVVTLVTDTSGIGDKGFNEIAWKGLMKAKEELGIVVKKIESSDPANYVKNLATAAKYSDLTIANGFLILDAMIEVAELYPQYDFVFIDGVIGRENVASYTFRSEEVGFLVGILAAGMSNTHRTGILKGMNIPPVETFEFGFRAGARCADLSWGTSTDVKSLTAGDFNDPQKGFSITSQFINDRRDVVFQLAGATALGAINAIKSSKQLDYLIGVDLDQDDEIPGKVLTSAMKRIDVVVYRAIKAKLENRFKGGHFSVGINEGALSLTDMRHTRDIIPARIHAAIGKAEEMIRANRVKLPVNDEQLEEFAPVDLEDGKR